MTHSIDIVNLFINHTINNVKKVKISQLLNVSLGTINKWSKIYSWNIRNSTLITKINKWYTHHGLSKKHKYVNQIVDYVNNHEGCSLNDISDNLPYKCLSLSTICRTLKENNITHKRYKTHVICKDPKIINQNRIDFSNNVDFNKFDDFICIDETSFCIDDFKKYGYSKSGKEIKRITKHSRNKQRLTLLSAISNNKIVKYEIHEGSIDGEKYKKFLRGKVFKNKTVLQDNVRFHHSIKVKEYANNHSIDMKYIPAYTPEFNAIELVFTKMKTIFRNLDHKNYVRDIVKSIKSITSNDLCNFYNHTKKIIKSYRTK